MIYDIFLSALTIAVGLAFIIQVADLYYTYIAESTIYTVERINSRITVPVILLCIWAVAVVAGFVLSEIFPVFAKKRIPVDNAKTLRNLMIRIPASKASSDYGDAIKGVKAWENCRLYVKSFTFGVLLSSALFILVYAFDPQNFHAENFKSDIMVLLRSVIFFLIISFASAAATAIYDNYAIKKELNFVKKAIASGDRTTGPASIARNFYYAAIIAVAVLSIFFIALYAAAPSMYASVIGGIADQKAIPLLFVFFAVICAIAVYAAVSFFTAKKRQGFDKRKVTIFSIASLAAMYALIVIMYIIAPSVLTAAMTKIESRRIIFLVFLFLAVIASALALIASAKKYVPEKADKIILTVTRSAIGVTAISFIIAGVLNGGAGDVLIKAINICTECIGLG